VRPAPEPTDARALRFEQAVVTLVLLAGFVFGVPYVIPALAVLVGVATLGGPPANLFGRVYAYLFFGRAGVERAGEAANVTRLTRLVETLLLVIASVFWALGIEPVAWVFALPVAAVTGLAATTGINLVALAHDRSRRA
jgi:hypothetical protein